MAKGQINWDNVQYNNTLYTSVTNVTVDRGAQTQTYSADNDHFKTLGTVIMNEPRMTLESMDEYPIMSIVPGTLATLTARHRYATSNPANTNSQNGDITYTMTNAMAESPKTGGGHGAMSGASISFVGLSSDGFTNPLSAAKT